VGGEYSGKFCGLGNMTDEHQIIFYSGPEGQTRVEVFFLKESLWLSQKRMAELFGVEVNTINYHLKEIFKSGELDEAAVIRNFRITASDGKGYPTNLYHLDAVIAVGYRVNSYQATRFRVWATGVLREYLLKGFVLDDARLKQGAQWGKALAEAEFYKFRVLQDAAFESDFDRVVKQLKTRIPRRGKAHECDA
jgi:hypothetical protein